MDIKQDPNAIPNFNASGRIGEHQQHEREQVQSSVQLDAGADGDGAASGEAETHESLLDDGSGLAAKPGQVNGAGAGPTANGSDRDARPDASKTGAGAIDGLVGAP